MKEVRRGEEGRIWYEALAEPGISGEREMTTKLGAERGYERIGAEPSGIRRMRVTGAAVPGTDILQNGCSYRDTFPRGWLGPTGLHTPRR